MHYGLCTMDYGLWTMNYALCTMDYELWTPLSSLHEKNPASSVPEMLW